MHGQLLGVFLLLCDKGASNRQTEQCICCQGCTRGIQKVMHLEALLVQDFTNLVFIWYKHDKTHLFVIVICFSFIFKFLKLKLDLEMAALLEARQKQRAVIELLVAEE